MTDDKKIYKFAILGSDKRQSVIANELLKRGHCVRVTEDVHSLADGMPAEICTNIEKALSNVDFIILPLPATRDGEHVSSQYLKISLCDIISLAKANGSIIIGGSIPSNIKKKCVIEGIPVFDYYASEELQKKNALPSAEGALMIAMENTDITVQGMNALVCGYGKTGSVLADILRKLGANVTVGARRDETLCEISLNGFNAIRLGASHPELVYASQNSDVIFNTVPAAIFTKTVTDQIKNRPVYIEIASAPGGIDLSAARDNGIKIIFAPSIPGKYSPITAGKYIFETICEILKETGVIL